MIPHFRFCLWGPLQPGFFFQLHSVWNAFLLFVDILYFRLYGTRRSFFCSEQKVYIKHYTTTEEPYTIFPVHAANGLRLKSKTSAPSERAVSWIERVYADRARKCLNYHSAACIRPNSIVACADHIPVSNAQKAENSAATVSIRARIRFLLVRRDIKLRDTRAQWQIRENFRTFCADVVVSKSGFWCAPHQCQRFSLFLERARHEAASFFRQSAALSRIPYLLGPEMLS